MPELPDVEGFRRLLARHATGQRIERVTAPAPEVVRNTTPQALGRAVHRRRFAEPTRHGKWLFAATDDGDGPVVVMHFAMSGFLAWEPGKAPRDEHDRVVFVCGDGELRFNQTRKFGGVWLARDEAGRDAITGPLGPDALGVDRDTFHDVLGGRRGMIKSALMDQEVLAGLGNLTVDEVLWQAGVHPRTRVDALDAEARDRVRDVMDDVLGVSVRRGRVPALDGWLTGARDDDAPTCPRCGAPLERATVAGRTTVWCPRCQQL